MAEDWQDCPALGPGWKRREAFESQGPLVDAQTSIIRGEKIRSKVELTRYLGPACDLTLFNFRQGILCYPVPKTHPLPAPNKKKKKPSKPAKAKKRQVGPQKSEVRKETPRKGRKAGAGPAVGSGAAAGAAPASLPALGCCENCGTRLSRDCIKRQRLKVLCKDCRAQRIAFNREQRMFRRVGCGECTACLVKEDCGACSICRLQLPRDVASELFCKCERRRCLRIVEKSRGCGVCRGCQTQEDCGRCRVCLRPARPGLKRQWRCLQRRCFWGKRDRRKSGSKVAARHHSRAQPLPPRPASQHPEPTELHISDLAPTSPAEFIYYCVDEDELQPYTNHHRQNRKCGACAACLRRMDCGHCDFCCDKPKFGGSNQKRQKCRWRQCLQFAMKRLLPSTGSGSEEGAGLPPCRPCRKRPGSPRRRLRLSSPSKAPLAVLTTPPGPARASAKQQAGRGFVLPPPDTDFVFLQEGAASPVQVPGPATASSEAPLQEAQSWGVAMPQVKQEKTDAPEEWTSGTGFPTSALQPGYPSKALDSDLPPVKQEPPGPEEDREENREDYVSESAPEEEAGGVGTPVITEIFSLGGTRLRDAAAWLPRSPFVVLKAFEVPPSPLLGELFPDDGKNVDHTDDIDLAQAVELRAKHPKAHRAEQHLKRIQRSYHKYHTTLASIKSNEQDRLRSDWLEHNDRKYFDSLVRARTKDAMQGFILNTEERRNRERCEELRSKLVSVHELKVGEERKAQVAFNEELKRQKLVEEQLYARLWEEDRLAKEKREAYEERRQKALVENTRLGLDAQVTSNLAQRQAEQRMKEEEARLLEKNNAQVKLEKEQEKLRKQKSKRETRNSLQKAVQEKLESLQQEHREEQDLNMKLVGRALQDLQEEADKKKQKREDMEREQKIYNDYLKQRRMEEKAQEKELDRILEDIKARKQAQKDQELALEKEARKRLQNEVMCTRKLQVQEKLQRKLKEQEELAIEQERINEGLKELNCEERESFARRCGLAKEYRNQLRMQIAYQQQALEAEKEEKRQEFEAGMAANKACLDRIQEILSEHHALSQSVHPMRRACPDKLPR